MSIQVVEHQLAAVGVAARARPAAARPVIKRLRLARRLNGQPLERRFGHLMLAARKTHTDVALV